MYKTDIKMGDTEIMAERERERLQWKQEWFEQWCKIIEDHKLQDLFTPVPEHFGFEYRIDDYHDGISCHFIIERGAPICVKILFMYATMAHDRAKEADKIYWNAWVELEKYGYDLSVKPLPDA